VPSKHVPLPSLKALLLSLGGGAGFAGIFVFLDQTPADSGIAPLVVMRIVGVSMLAVAVLALNSRDRKLSKPKDKFPKVLIGMIAISAVLDVSANLFFLIGTREGVSDCRCCNVSLPNWNRGFGKDCSERKAC